MLPVAQPLGNYSIGFYGNFLLHKERSFGGGLTLEGNVYFSGGVTYGCG